MPILAALIWFAEPAPLDMPRAEAYLVTDSDGRRHLEDRFDELDLWTARSVLGRWKDQEGRMLTLARLAYTAPAFADSSLTRASFRANAEPLARKDEDALDLAVSRLSPFDLPEETSSPRQPVRGMKRVLHYGGTNETAVVCAFLPERHPSWYLAVWELAPGDDFAEMREAFEKEFLAEWRDRVEESLPSELGQFEAKAPARPAGRRGLPPERELLSADAAWSVTNYPDWHVTAAPEFVVLDDLPRGSTFVATLTNELSRMRRAYAETIPTPLDATNVLAVARIFADRGEYLGALEDNEIAGMEWSGAYWSPRRRELVAYLPPDGAKELLKTFRHEAFHQYLSYACSMIPASPWLNEGYAQYFEDTESQDWGIAVDLDQVAEILPGVMGMDYGDFYAGTDAERQLKYRIAWSVALFLEKGAPEVRFRPFAGVKTRYVDALLRTRDMRRATAEAFESRERLELFVAEWKKFWEKR